GSSRWGIRWNALIFMESSLGRPSRSRSWRRIVLVEAPGEDVRRRHLDDDRIRRGERCLPAVLRIFFVEASARLLEARPALDERCGALHHDTAELRPVVGVEIDGERDPRILPQIGDLSRVVAGAEVDLVTGEHVANGDEVSLAVAAR